MGCFCSTFKVIHTWKRCQYSTTTAACAISPLLFKQSSENITFGSKKPLTVSKAPP